MNTIEDINDAERAAYARGDMETSKLLQSCIALIDSERAEAVEEYQSGLREKMDDAVEALNGINVKIDYVIDELS